MALRPIVGFAGCINYYSPELVLLFSYALLCSLDVTVISCCFFDLEVKGVIKYLACDVMWWFRFSTGGRAAQRWRPQICPFEYGSACLHWSLWTSMWGLCSYGTCYGGSQEVSSTGKEIYVLYLLSKRELDFVLLLRQGFLTRVFAYQYLRSTACLAF